MKKITLLLLTILYSHILYSQTTFQSVYGTTAREDILDLKETSDGGIVIMARSYRNLYLLKINSTGKKLWSKSYPILDVFIGSVIALDNGSLLFEAYGYLSSTSSMTYLFKTDASGNFLWGKSYSYPIINAPFRSIKQTSDGGFIATGNYPYPEKSMLVKLDSSGNVMWERMTGATVGTDVIQSKLDLSYIVGGSLTVGGGTANPAIISKFDKNGNHLWSKQTSLVNYSPIQLVEKSNGTLQMNYYGGILELDKDADNGTLLQLQAEHFIPSPLLNWFPSKQADKGYYCLSSIELPNRAHDILLTKLDSLKNFLWCKNIGGPKDDWTVSALQSKDNGILLGATTYSFSHGESDNFIIKTDTAGSFSCNSESFILEPQITTVSNSVYVPALDTTLRIGVNPFSMNSVIIKDSANDACGCIHPIANFTVSPPYGYITDQSVWGMKWYWNFGDGTTDTIQINPHHQFKLGTYNVCLTVKNDCGADSVCHKVIITSVNQITLDSKINIYPNPFTSQATIQFTEEQKDCTIKIMDLLGKEIKTINFTGKELIIEKEGMKGGIYFIQFVDTKGKTSIIKKIVLQ